MSALREMELEAMLSDAVDIIAGQGERGMGAWVASARILLGEESRESSEAQQRAHEERLLAEGRKQGRQALLARLRRAQVRAHELLATAARDSDTARSMGHVSAALGWVLDQVERGHLATEAEAPMDTEATP